MTITVIGKAAVRAASDAANKNEPQFIFGNSFMITSIEIDHHGEEARIRLTQIMQAKPGAVSEQAHKSKSYEFDEEAAKAGAPVEFYRGAMDGSSPGAWVQVHYVGRTVGTGHVIQFDDGSLLTTTALRMKRVVKTVFANLCRNGQWFEYQSPADAEAAAPHGAMAGSCPVFAVAVPVEIEEP